MASGENQNSIQNLIPIYLKNAQSTSFDVLESSEDLYKILNNSEIPMLFKLSVLKKLLTFLNFLLKDLQKKIEPKIEKKLEIPGSTILNNNQLLGNSTFDNYDVDIANEMIQTETDLDMIDNFGDQNLDEVSNFSISFKKRKKIVDKIIEIRDYTKKIKNVSDILEKNDINEQKNILESFKINLVALRNLSVHESNVEIDNNYDNSYNTFDAEENFNETVLEFEGLDETGDSFKRAESFFRLILACNEKKVVAKQAEEYGNIDIEKL